MKATLALFVVGLAVASAWKAPNWLTHQDVKEIQGKGQKVIDEQKEDFKKAAGANDKQKMSQMTINLLNHLKTAKANNDKALPGIQKITAALRAKADKVDHSWFQGELLKLIVEAVDGNRDNISYYTLDACSIWIEERLGSIKDSAIAAKYTDAKKKIEEARDALDAQAQVFVKAVKEIKSLSDWSGSKTKQNAEKIRDEVSKVEKANAASQLEKFTNEAIEKVTALTHL